MVKVLIILILIIYVFYKTAGFLFRLVFGSLRQDPGRFQQRQRPHAKRAAGSKLTIDKIPNASTRKGGSYDGGEYVDFEEVK